MSSAGGERRNNTGERERKGRKTFVRRRERGGMGREGKEGGEGGGGEGKGMGGICSIPHARHDPVPIPSPLPLLSSPFPLQLPLPSFPPAHAIYDNSPVRGYGDGDDWYCIRMYADTHGGGERGKGGKGWGGGCRLFEMVCRG